MKIMNDKKDLKKRTCPAVAGKINPYGKMKLKMLFYDSISGGGLKKESLGDR